MRITNSMMVSRMLYNLMNNMEMLDTSQQQLATGKKYVLPEEDPVGNVISMGYRTHITEIEQYTRNIDDGMTWLNTAEDSLNHTTEYLQRLKTLTIEGANSHLDQVDRDAIAMEIDQIIKGLVDVANTEFRGEFIFGGHETSSAPFEFYYGKESGQSDDVLTYDWRGGFEDRLGIVRERITEVRYTGDSGMMERQIQKSLYIDVNDPGNIVFDAPAHRVQGGSTELRELNLALNDGPAIPGNPPTNYNNAINPATAGIGVFSIGLEGGKIEAIAYDANTHTIEDIRDKINEANVDVTASIERIADEERAEVYYQLKLESDIAGREIVITDDDQQREKRSAAPMAPVNTALNWGASGIPGPPDGIVRINGVEFDLADYAGQAVDIFLTAVEADSRTGVEEFYFDTATNEFVIRAEDGESLELEENGANGLFTALNIQTRGNLMETLQVRNWVQGDNAVDPTVTLDTIPGILEGNITIGGKEIEIDFRIDTLESVVDKINDADVGTTAYLEEWPVNSGSGQFRLMLRSSKPGEIEISDRGSDFFKTLGLLEPNSGVLRNYTSEIQDPRKIKIFDTVINIRNHLLNGDLEALNNSDLESLRESLDLILQYRAKMGARVNTMETAQTKLAEIKLHTSSLLSKVEDVDIADTIMKLKLQENVHQSAMAAGARIIYSSLVDFLR